MKKLLFIRYKKSGRILEGGEQVSQKNFDILARLLGESNIDTVYIQIIASLTSYLHKVFLRVVVLLFYRIERE